MQCNAKRRLLSDKMSLVRTVNMDRINRGLRDLFFHEEGAHIVTGGFVVLHMGTCKNEYGGIIMRMMHSFK